ncbi:ammecr1 [Anaeramoeba flamelloides]|uniref:Ammecr1 n=1 Tax=Anaeramoeba flamelloides TaxID=1746091 RepID=A0ABQ8Y3W8_9EUKA|nr:ammecr1 [Anaeramoeba flamelloides]
MCYYAFDVLHSELTGQDQKIIPLGFSNNELSPLFVTFNTVQNDQAVLRGCIGTFSPQPLLSGIKRLTISAAFHDSRFRPITTSELLALNCTISLLGDFEKISDPFDWVPGKHGIQIQISNKMGATYLPEVSIEHFDGDKEKTLNHLIQKAGYRSAINEKFLGQITVERYQSSTFACSYQGYVEKFQKSDTNSFQKHSEL